MSNPIPTFHTASQFAQILNGLRHTVAKYIAKDRNAGPMIILICNCLSRLAARFAALAERAQAGTLRATPRRSARNTARAVASPRAPSPLPAGFASLGNLMWETRLSGTQLQHLVLNDPEMAALIAACPQVGRILRTLFWMTALRPIPTILRVSRPKVARVSPRPAPEDPLRREVSRSKPPAGRSPSSEPPARGKARGWKREAKFWAQPRGKLRSTAGPPRKAGSPKHQPL